MKLSKLDLSNEMHVRHAVSIIYSRMTVLEMYGYLTTYAKGKVVMDANKKFTTTPHMMQLADK